MPSIDVDGSIGTLKYFAKIGAKLGDAHMLRDGGPMRLARDPNFQGLHVGVPLDGVAVHINAFNFPGVGIVGESRCQPAGGRAGICQACNFDRVAGAGDGERCDRCRHSSSGSVVDSVRLAERPARSSAARRCRGLHRLGAIRVREFASIPRIRQQNIRVNIEADSLNAALLGPDVAPDSPEFGFFAREVVREMTSKAGQKCTAIRRILVPADKGQRRDRSHYRRR